AEAGANRNQALVRRTFHGAAATLSAKVVLSIPAVAMALRPVPAARPAAPAGSPRGGAGGPRNAGNLRGQLPGRPGAAGRLPRRPGDGLVRRPAAAPPRWRGRRRRDQL